MNHTITRFHVGFLTSWMKYVLLDEKTHSITCSPLRRGVGLTHISTFLKEIIGNYHFLDEKSHFHGFSSKRRVIGIDNVKCGGWRYPACTETQRAHISFTHSATINGPHPSIFKPTQAPTSISPCHQRLLWRSSSSLPFLSPPFGRDSRGAIAIFLWLLVPVVVAACCASN
jgi:hypothetical protein